VSIAAAQTDRGLPFGSNRRDQLLVHASSQNHHGNVTRLHIGDAQSIDELRFFAKLREGTRKRSAAAMHHGDLVTFVREIDDRAGTFLYERFIVERSTTDFHD